MVERGLKKAQGHVEMILSFIIFLGFIIAIFVFLNPFEKPKLGYSSLNDCQKKIFDNLSISYKTFSITLNSSTSATCFSIIDPFSLNSKTLVHDINGNIRMSKKSSDKLYVQNTVGARYFKVFVSDNLENYTLQDTSGCVNLNMANYSLGILNQEKSVSYENIIALNQSYMTNYNQLKLNLGLQNDFTYVIYDANKATIFNESLTRNKLKNSNVLARDIPLTAIWRNATRIDVIFHLEVW